MVLLPRFREECVVAPTPSRLFNRTSNKSRRMSTADIGDGKMNIALSLSLSLSRSHGFVQCPRSSVSSSSRSDFSVKALDDLVWALQF